MTRKFGLRIFYAAAVLLVVWLAYLGFKTANALWSPVPSSLDASEHGANIHFEADRSTLLFDADCAQVSWRTSGIHSVSLGDSPRIGSDHARRCGDELRLHVEFVDGSETDYLLPRELIFDIPNQLVTLILTVLVLYLACAYWLVGTAEPAVTRQEIRPLTSFRALAALTVFFYHWTIPVAGLLFALQNEGLMGVTLFFVLSGFLIAGRYMDEISQQTFRWRFYWLRRAARILPLYLAVLIIVALWHEPINLANLTLTQAYFPDLWKTGIPPAWTLTLEETFYLLLPLVLWLCWRTRLRWIVLGGVVVLAYGIGRLLVAADVWPLFFMLMRTICGHMVDFMIGVGCAFIYRRWRPGSRAWILTVLCGIGLLVWGLILANALEEPTIIYGDWAIAVLTGGLILSLTAPSGWIVRLLSWRPLVYAGRVSYAFYLFHYTRPAKELYDTLAVRFGDATPLAQLVVVGLLCVGLYELIEKPAHKWILSRFDQKGGRQAIGLQPAQ